MLLKLLRSIALTAGVAAAGAWPLVYLGINFISSFIFLVILQFVGFYFYNEHVQRKIALEEQKIINEREQILSQQGMDVACPCDRRVKAFVPISLSGRNEYTCPGCDKTISVYIEPKTALVTTPVDTSILNDLKLPNGNS